MATPRKGRYIDSFLKRADKAVQDGVKKADEVLDSAVDLGAMTAKQAAQAAADLHAKAQMEKEELQKRSAEKLGRAAVPAGGAVPGAGDDLDVLERLGRLRKAKVITEREFQSKKKKILDRI